MCSGHHSGWRGSGAKGRRCVLVAVLCRACGEGVDSLCKGTSFFRNFAASATVYASRCDCETAALA